MFKIIRLGPRSNYRWIHSSCSLSRRHSRPGSSSEVGLEELITDKPPNEYETIRQKLDRINYYDNPIRTKNIGFDDSTKLYQSFLNQAGNIVLKHSKVTDENDEEFDERDDGKDIKLEREDYDKLSSYYPFTRQYIETTIQLAHHYAIYRDLFFQEPFMNETSQDLIAANAKDEVKFHKLEHRELYHFSPLVPITAIFSSSNNQSNKDEEITYLKSFRGNLIPAEYGRLPPQILINTSGINDGDFDINEVPTSSNLVTINSGQKPDLNFYTLALVNLDSHFSDSGVCHWMIGNICRDGDKTIYDTFIDYLPVYAIRGLGYHRYAFVLFQSDQKIHQFERITDFDLGRRKFNGLSFMSMNSDVQIRPIGLSWFQTTWSDYCKSIFHDILNMRCPTYEYIFPKQSTQFNQLQYPGRAPFNLYLDAFRNPKDLSKEVLLERLKSINPMESYDTDKMFPTYEGRPKFPHIHPHPPNTPDWLKSTLIRKRSQVGRFRGLRASSAILPYNNNADLDRPKWPRISADVHPLNVPNPYPDTKRRPKPLRDTLWSKPLPEHHSLRIDFPENLQDNDKSNLEKTPSTS